MYLKHIFWNLFGLGAPLLIAAISIPPLLQNIGSERFGLLALSWGLIGYAGILDLGIGRATTQKVSTLLGGSNEEQVPDVLSTAIRITTITGFIGMFLILTATFSGVYTVIKTESVSIPEMQYSLLMLAIALPAQAVSATYKGINEAYLNFKGINILRIALGSANFGAPYLVSLWTNQVHWLVATLVLSRLLALVVYWRLAKKCIDKDQSKENGCYDSSIAKDLFTFGSWFSISSIVGPVLIQADRFFIASLVSASAVTIYVIPYEVVVQGLILVGAISSVAFPVISRLLATNITEASALFNQWLIRVIVIIGLAMILLAYFLPSLLQMWLGELSNPESIIIGRILCIGVFFNSIGVMYFSLLHAQGRTKITALFHIIELPVYIVVLILLINEYGIIGAAITWSARTIIDMLFLFSFSKYKHITKSKV